MHWFFTGLLIAASAGIVAYGGFLLRGLFTTDPAAPPVEEHAATAPAAAARPATEHSA